MTPRRFLQRLLPHRHHVAGHRSLRFLGQRLHDPELWHLTRRSTAGATALGLFLACLPVPGQTVLAALFAVGLRVNLLVAIVATWASNPLTMAPLLWLVYHTGNWLLGSPAGPVRIEVVWRWFEHAAGAGRDWLLGRAAEDGAGVAVNWDWIAQTAQAIWPPLALGSLAVGGAFALVGYFGVHWLWRLHLVGRWRARRAARRPPPRREP